jgi:hypothetical protein
MDNSSATQENSLPETVTREDMPQAAWKAPQLTKASMDQTLVGSGSGPDGGLSTV